MISEHISIRNMLFTVHIFSHKTGKSCLGGSEEAPTFLGLHFKNFSFFPRGKVFEVGTVFSCRVRQDEREEREGDFIIYFCLEFWLGVSL